MVQVADDKKGVFRLSDVMAREETPDKKAHRLGDVMSMEREPNVSFPDGVISISDEDREKFRGLGKIGFFEQFRRQDKTEMIPFNPEGAIKSVGLLQSVNRIKEDKAEQEDIERVNNYLVKLEEERERGFSTGGNITRGVAQLPGFMIEFIATGGLATLGKKAVKSSVEKVAKDAIENRVLKFATQTAALAGGATMRTAAMPHRVIEGAAERQLNASLELTEKGMKIAEEATVTPHLSAMKAFGDVLIENFSEVTGPAISLVAKKLIPNKLAVGLAKLFKAAHPEESVNKLFTKAGYNGFLVELGEERVGAFLKAAFGVEDFGAENPDQIVDRIISSIPNGEELLVEAGVLAFPAGLNMTIGQSVKLIQKRKLDNKEQQLDNLSEISDKQAESILSNEAQELGDLENVPEPEAEQFKTNRQLIAEQPDGIKKSLIRSADGIGKFADGIFGVISTRLAKINPKLRTRLRRFEFDSKNAVLNDEKSVVLFLEGAKQMSEQDAIDFDLARKNGNKKVLDALTDKYQLQDQNQVVRQTLDALYERANAVGLDVRYLENFHPRSIEDPEGMMSYLQKQEGWSEIKKAIDEKQTELGRYLSVEEKATLVNSLLRGYGNSQIRLSKPGKLKDRSIDVVTPELNQFYKDSNTALLEYIYAVNDAIEARKFFGKKNKDKKDKLTDVNVTNDIGAFTLELIERGELSPDKEAELSEILKARFNQRGTSGIVRVYKNLSYIDTMGSPISAITQIGDIAFALHKTGFFNTSKSLLRAVAGESRIKKEDIGIERIAEEFTAGDTSSKAVSKVFKLIGLEWMDALGKNTTINATILNYKNLVEKGDKDAMQALEDIFGEETQQVIKDLKEGKVSENVKFLAFNELANIQPIALSEVPEKYLTGGNGRIFYMLKTFTIKLFDVYRNDVFMQLRKTPLKGLKNLISLTSALVVMNATSDLIKDFLLGREIKMEDLVVDNILKLMGFSKFSIYKARQEGIGSATVRTILPPFKFIDALYKDIVKQNKIQNLETINSIPFGGKLYYWWFGKGSKKK